MQFVTVTDADESEAVEIPLEEDGTVTLCALASQFPGTTGLKYQVDGHTRAVRLSNEKLFAPDGGWGNHTYICTFPKGNSKRKADDGLETSDSKVSKTSVESESNWLRTDLVVLGLPWTTTDQELREYFSQFGELQFAEVKVDPMTKKSKGFGFVRFSDQEVHVRVMLNRHKIGGRWCDVRMPVSKEAPGKKSPYKVFVGQCTEEHTKEVLKEHFSKFGEISDLYVPSPFRGFAFVTFTESNVAKVVCGQEHIIKNTRVVVTEAVPKKTERSDRGRPSGRGMIMPRRGDDFYSGDYYDKRSSYGGRDDNGWRDWSDDSAPNPRGVWSSAGNGSGWSAPNSGGRWRDVEPAIDPNIVAAAVNKAVMGVIGTIKGQSQSPVNMSPGMYGGDDGKWFSRR